MREFHVYCFDGQTRTIAAIEAVLAKNGTVVFCGAEDEAERIVAQFHLDNIVGWVEGLPIPEGTAH